MARLLRLRRPSALVGQQPPTSLRQKRLHVGEVEGPAAAIVGRREESDPDAYLRYADVATLREPNALQSHVTSHLTAVHQLGGRGVALDWVELDEVKAGGGS